MGFLPTIWRPHTWVFGTPHAGHRQIIGKSSAYLLVFFLLWLLR
jgi:hypothetical protein